MIYIYYIYTYYIYHISSILYGGTKLKDVLFWPKWDRFNEIMRHGHTVTRDESQMFFEGKSHISPDFKGLLWFLGDNWSTGHHFIVVPCPHLAARSPNPNTATVILIYKDVILPVTPIGRPKGKVSWSRGAFNGNFVNTGGYFKVVPQFVS